MFDANKFWVGETSEAAPATDKDFQLLETEFGIKLPALQKELYRIQNGGMVDGVDTVVFWPVSSAGWCKVQRVQDVQYWSRHQNNGLVKLGSQTTA